MMGEAKVKKLREEKERLEREKEGKKEQPKTLSVNVHDSFIGKEKLQ